jgi:hypothetical protein
VTAGVALPVSRMRPEAPALVRTYRATRRHVVSSDAPKARGLRATLGVSPIVLLLVVVGGFAVVGALV